MIPRDGDPLTGSTFPLDRDLGRAFLYTRFDPAIGPRGLKELGLEHIASENVVAMDKVSFLPEMQELERAYACRHVDMSPFMRFA